VPAKGFFQTRSRTRAPQNRQSNNKNKTNQKLVEKSDGCEEGAKLVDKTRTRPFSGILARPRRA
jgi:hypothetical protein